KEDTQPQEIRGGTPEQQGHALYARTCQGCHGVDRTGVLLPKQIGADRFRSIVQNGQGEMPAFRDLTPQNLDALAAYIDNPAAGALPPATPGNVRYLGQYASFLYANNG